MPSSSEQIPNWIPKPATPLAVPTGEDAERIRRLHVVPPPKEAALAGAENEEDTLPTIDVPAALRSRETPAPEEGSGEFMHLVGFQDDFDIQIKEDPDHVFADRNTGLFGVMDDAASEAMRLKIVNAYTQNLREILILPEHEVLQKITAHQLQRFGITPSDSRPGENLPERAGIVKAVTETFENRGDMAHKALALLKTLSEVTTQSTAEDGSAGNGIFGFVEGDDVDFQTAVPGYALNRRMAMGITVTIGEGMRAYKRRADGERVPVTDQSSSESVPKLAARGLNVDDQLEFTVGDEEEIAVIAKRTK